MARDRAQASIERLIADHVANAFEPRNRETKADAVAAQIRNRITERFTHGALGLEQDNKPPAIIALRDRIIAAFSLNRQEQKPEDRAAQLAGLKAALETSRSASPSSSLVESMQVRLLLQRERLLAKNELTEHFGRMEVWLLSIAFLLLVLLKSVHILWALPILGFGVARAWRLDQRCKARLKTVAEIEDVLAGKRPPSRKILTLEHDRNDGPISWTR